MEGKMDNYAAVLSQELGKRGIQIGGRLPPVVVGDKITGIAPNGSLLQQITASGDLGNLAIVRMANEIALKYKDISCQKLMLPSGEGFHSEIQTYGNLIIRIVSNKNFGTRFDILFQDNLAFVPVD